VRFPSTLSRQELQADALGVIAAHAHASSGQVLTARIRLSHAPAQGSVWFTDVVVDIDVAGAEVPEALVIEGWLVTWEWVLLALEIETLLLEGVTVGDDVCATR